MKETKTVRAKTPKLTPMTQPEIQPDISELLEKKIKSTKSSKSPESTSTTSEESISLHIWDFAGHELYYTTHQVPVVSIISIQSLCASLAAQDTIKNADIKQHQYNGIMEFTLTNSSIGTS